MSDINVLRGATIVGMLYENGATKHDLGEIEVETRILIVDDSRIVRERLRDMLQDHPQWKVSAEAASGSEAVAEAKHSRPDLIVLDLLMPGMNGLQAALELSKVAPNVPILMFTMHLSKQLIDEARHVGIRGAVAKYDPKRVVEGVEALLRNESYFAAPN